MINDYRIIFDTNIYGVFFTSSDNLWIPSAIKKHNITVCGSAIIRQELRNIPKKIGVGKSKLREITLKLYDGLVSEKRNYSVTEFVEQLAEKYKEHYNAQYNWKEITNDFLIIATASLHNIDI